MVKELSARADIKIPPAPISAAAFAVIGTKLIILSSPTLKSFTVVVVVLAVSVKLPFAVYKLIYD